MKRVFALMLTAALLLGASAAAEKRKVEPLLLPMPLYNQHDYAEPVFTWNERDVTVEESGCGAACVAMVVGYFEPDDAPEPDDVMSLAGKLGLYRGDGLGRDALRLDEYGVEGCWRKMDARAIENTLRKGTPIVEYVGAGYFTENGHYVVLRGITEDGKLLVADPNSEEKTTQKTYRFATIIQLKENETSKALSSQFRLSLTAPFLTYRKLHKTADVSKILTFCRHRRREGRDQPACVKNQFIRNFCRTCAICCVSAC